MIPTIWCVSTQRGRSRKSRRTEQPDRSASPELGPNLRAIPDAEFLKDFLGVPPSGMETDAARVRDFLCGLSVRKTASDLELPQREVVLLLERRIGERRMGGQSNNGYRNP